MTGEVAACSDPDLQRKLLPKSVSSILLLWRRVNKTDVTLHQTI